MMKIQVINLKTMRKNNARTAVTRDIFVINRIGDNLIAISPLDNPRMGKFEDFVRTFAEHNLTSNIRPIPDTLLMHYRIKSDLEPHMRYNNGATTPFGEYVLRKVTSVDVKAERIVSLHDAMYCFQNDLDPLSPDNCRDNLQRQAAYLACVATYSGEDTAIN